MKVLSFVRFFVRHTIPNKILPILFSVLVFAGCKSDEKKKVFIQKMKKRNQKNIIFQVSIIQYDFKLSFGVKKEWMLHLPFLPTLAISN
jgi:uncharacterized lipoprotein YajG